MFIPLTNHAVRRQIPKECAVENYFYCHELDDGERSFLGETFLADLESASSGVLKAAQQGNLPTTLRDPFHSDGRRGYDLGPNTDVARYSNSGQKPMPVRRLVSFCVLFIPDKL